MPIYDYRCGACGRRFEMIIAAIETKPDRTCPKCGSANIERLISRFRVVKSLESRLEAMADPSKLGELDEENPESMLKWAKNLGQAMGEDLDEDLQGMMEAEFSRSDEPDLDAEPNGGLSE